jgi:LPS export ABC transporter protein LptC
MNVNLFFVFLIAGLLAIFLLFKPLKIKEQTFVHLPKVELKNFTFYELDKEGVKRFMKAKRGVVYSDKYEVYTINYTDNLHEYKIKIHSDYGSYKGDEIVLDGNVKFSREDGFVFKTQNAVYNQSTNILTIDNKYSSYRGLNTLDGSSLRYNNKLNKIESSDVTLVYQLEESF